MSNLIIKNFIYFASQYRDPEVYHVWVDKISNSHLFVNYFILKYFFVTLSLSHLYSQWFYFTKVISVLNIILFLMFFIYF